MKFSISAIPKMGDMNSSTKTLQEALTEKGFSPGSIDGIFGKKTAMAVAKFQKEVVGTQGTGVIGPKTLSALEISVKVVDPVSGAPTITKECGKLDRRLHPSWRLMIEKRVFPNGKVEDLCWLTGDIDQCLEVVLRAMAAMQIFEKGGYNKGLEVGYVQGVTGKYTEGGNGDPWCADWWQSAVAFIEDYFQQESPCPASAGVMDTLKKAKKIPGMVVTKPRRGACALAERGTSGKGHAMPIVEIIDEDDMLTCEGNTSVSNIRDGDGSGLKNRKIWKNGDLFTRGFVLIYPENKLPKPIAQEEQKPIETPQPVGDYSEAFTAAWDGKHADSPKWTKYALDAIDKYGTRMLALKELKDAPEFAPMWSKMTRNQRKHVLLMMISSMCKPESNFKPATKYTESFADAQGKKVISRGLLQVSIESSNSYLPKEERLTNAEKLHDPKLNIEIGVRILDRWLCRDLYFAGTKSANVGGGRYWSCLRPYNKGKLRDGYVFIKTNMKNTADEISKNIAV